MLEAVHLLLAADLFVVVVAVDPTWLLTAIGSHYPDLPNPTQYLEKIFQVVLTLPSLDTAGYQRMLRGLVGTRADEDPAPLPFGASETPAAVPPVPLSPKAPPAGGASVGVSLPRPREVDRVDPFALHPDEIRLLDLVGPPHLIATPRQAKRLANSYGLLTALREPVRSADLDKGPGYYPYRAGLVLLAVLVAQPADGTDFLKVLKAAAAANPGGSWTDFLTGRADDAPATALLEITRTAAGHDLALPEPLCAWSEWIVPVGRLSFPAGSVR
jgi:KAP-like P-loop domain-containing protein